MGVTIFFSVKYVLSKYNPSKQEEDGGWNSEDTSILSFEYPDEYSFVTCSDYAKEDPSISYKLDSEEITEEEFMKDYVISDKASALVKKGEVKIFINSWTGEWDNSYENGNCFAFRSKGMWTPEKGSIVSEYSIEFNEEKYNVFDFEEEGIVYGVIDSERKDSFSPRDGIIICSPKSECVSFRFEADQESYEMEKDNIKKIINSVKINFDNS